MRRFLFVLVLALFLILGAQADQPAPGSTGVPISGVVASAQGATLYSQPVNSSDLIATWPQGTAVTVETLGLYWCRVTDGAASGYVLTTALFLDDWGEFGPAGENATQGPRFVLFDKGTIPGAAWTLTLRDKPNRKAAKMGTYVCGTIMVPLEKDKEYTLVHVGDKVGYLLTKYLTFHDAAQTPAKHAVVDNDKRVAFRYNRTRAITYLEPGTVVTLIWEARGWALVEVGGLQGYIVSTFLKVLD